MNQMRDRSTSCSVYSRCFADFLRPLASRFHELACRYHGSLVRLAAAFVPGRALAEDVARDTWLGVLAGAGRFDGRAPAVLTGGRRSRPGCSAS